MRILVVISDPITDELSPVLALEEWQTIARAMVQKHVSVQLIRLYPPTWQQLRQILLGQHGNFDIVHFIGHGNAAGIVLEDEFGCMDHVSASDLAVALTQRGVRLVVLNVCESESPATTIVQAGISAAVGTTESITNQQAIVLAQELYSALASGQPLNEAMKQVRIALRRIEGDKASAIPIIIGDRDIQIGYVQSNVELPRFQTLNMPKHNLPHPTKFFGRREELLWGIQALASTDHYIVEITGLGGIGKSSLGLQLAHRSAWRFFGGVVWLEPNKSATSLTTYLTNNARNVLFSKNRSLEQVVDPDFLLAEMNQYPILLVFDDPDRLSEGLLVELSDLLKRMPVQSGSKVMFITRTRMPIIENTDGVATITLGGLDSESACSLLRRRATLQQINDLAYASDDTLKALTDRLGNHPKMIELAIGLVRIFGLAESQHYFSNLPDPFIKKLEALLSTSVSTLSRKDVEALRLASTFTGQFSKDWLVRMGGQQVENSLPILINANLVDRDQSTGYYKLHPIVQDYITNTMPIGDEHFIAHTHFVTQRVSELSSTFITRDIKPVHPEFDLIVNETREVIHRLSSQSDDEACIHVRDLAVGVRDFLHAQQDWKTIEEIDEAAVHACQFLNDEVGLGAALVSIGAAIAAQGKFADGEEKCSEGLGFLLNSKDPHLLSIGYGSMGFINRLQGKMKTAKEYYDRGLSLAREVGDVTLEIRHLSNLGTIHRREKEWDFAEKRYTQALDLATNAGDQLSIAILLDNLGTISRYQDKGETSLQYYKNAYQIKKSIGDEHGLRITLTNMAITLKDLGKISDAIALLEDVLWSLDESAGTLEWWQVLLQLGRAHREFKDWKTAREYYELALKIAESGHYLKGISMCERGIGLCYEGEGKHKLAFDHVNYSFELTKQLNDPFINRIQADLHRIEESMNEQK